MRTRRATGKTRLLIADDEDLFAQLVEALVETDDTIEVVGRARTGEEAVALARTLSPDVIVMDIGMPLLDGIEATRRIRKSQPGVRVVIFTGSDESWDVLRARDAGAVAYVRKEHIGAVLLAAVHRAAQGVDEPRPDVAQLSRLQSAGARL